MSRRRYEGEDYGDHEDRAFADHRQQLVDDEAEAREIEAKRNASGISAEILSLQEAFLEGQRAGQMGLAAGLNPYQAGIPEHAEWERGRSAVIGARLNSNINRRVA